MKKMMSMFVLSMALATSVYAGAGHDHSGAGCPMHGEKNAVLTEASKALEATNADLSKKLGDMAANCCGKH